MLIKVSDSSDDKSNNLSCVGRDDSSCDRKNRNSISITIINFSIIIMLLMLMFEVIVYLAWCVICRQEIILIPFCRFWNFQR